MVAGLLPGLDLPQLQMCIRDSDNGIAATARRVVRLADGRIIEDREQEVDWL